MTRLSLPAYDQLSTDQMRVYDDIAAGPRDLLGAFGNMA